MTQMQIGYCPFCGDDLDGLPVQRHLMASAECRQIGRERVEELAAQTRERGRTVV